MKHWYTLRDNINNETLQFSTRYDAECEIKNRLMQYTYIYGCKPILIENNRDLIITTSINKGDIL